MRLTTEIKLRPISAWALGASYRIMTYLNPPSGSAKSRYLFLMNQMVKRGGMYMPDLICGEYYRYFRHNVLRCAANQKL